MSDPKRKTKEPPIWNFERFYLFMMRELQAMQAREKYKPDEGMYPHEWVVELLAALHTRFRTYLDGFKS